MIEYNPDSEESTKELDKSSVSVIGIGGAGANVLDRIALEGMVDAELVSMNTDIRALTNAVSSRKVQLGAEITRGLGAGGDPELGLEAARHEEAVIREAVEGREMVFICAGLGGGTGSGAAPYVARIAQELGAFVVVFATLPFSFEGNRRVKQAQRALNELQKNSNALITFENDRMGQLALSKSGIQEAFATGDQVISQSVRAVTTLVTQPGLIRIGMDDLMTALRNTESRCLFGYGQAKGKNRATEALREAMKSPLLDRGKMLDRAASVLVHIAGGDSMTLYEVELLMKSLNKHVSDDAHILFGVASDEKLGETLSVTVITSIAAETEAGSADAESLNPAIEAEAPPAVAPAPVGPAPTPAPESNLPAKVVVSAPAPTPTPAPAPVEQPAPVAQEPALVGATAEGELVAKKPETATDSEPKAETIEVSDEKPEPVAASPESNQSEVEIEISEVSVVAITEKIEVKADSKAKVDSTKEIEEPKAAQASPVETTEEEPVAEAVAAEKSEGNEEVETKTEASIPAVDKEESTGPKLKPQDPRPGNLKPELSPRQTVTLRPSPVVSSEKVDLEAQSTESLIDQEDSTESEQERKPVTGLAEFLPSVFGISPLMAEPSTAEPTSVEDVPEKKKPVDKQPTAKTPSKDSKLEAEQSADSEEKVSVIASFIDRSKISNGIAAVTEPDSPAGIRDGGTVSEDKPVSKEVPAPVLRPKNPGLKKAALSSVKSKKIVEEKVAQQQPEPATAGTAQSSLKLDEGKAGRFAKGEPTIVDGEDLDVPTFLRRKS